eukprot:5794528-Pyramimonas_sp.AAC.1
MGRRASTISSDSPRRGPGTSSGCGTYIFRAALQRRQALFEISSLASRNMSISCIGRGCRTPHSLHIPQEPRKAQDSSPFERSLKSAGSIG